MYDGAETTALSPWAGSVHLLDRKEAAVGLLVLRRILLLVLRLHYFSFVALHRLLIPKLPAELHKRHRYLDFSIRHT